MVRSMLKSGSRRRLDPRIAGPFQRCQAFPLRARHSGIPTALKGLPADSGTQRAWLCGCRTSTRRLPRFLEWACQATRPARLSVGRRPSSRTCGPSSPRRTCRARRAAWEGGYVAVDAKEALLGHQNSCGGPSQVHRRPVDAFHQRVTFR